MRQFDRADDDPFNDPAAGVLKATFLDPWVVPAFGYNFIGCTAEEAVEAAKEYARQIDAVPPALVARKVKTS